MTWLDDVIFLSILWINSPCSSLHESHLPFPFLFLSWSSTREFIVSSSSPNNFWGFPSPFEQPVASLSLSLSSCMSINFSLIMYFGNETMVIPFYDCAHPRRIGSPLKLTPHKSFFSSSELGVVSGIFLCRLQSIETEFSASIMLLSQRMCVSGPLFWTRMVSVIQRSVILRILIVWSTQEAEISNIW